MSGGVVVSVVMPVRNEVTGYKIDPFGGHVFYGVDLKG